MAVKGFVSKI